MTWPICIIEDRYQGVYSGGKWLAASGRDEEIEDANFGSPVQWILHWGGQGPHGSDTEAMEFWSNPPDWIAVGDTPDAALAAFMTSHKS